MEIQHLTTDKYSTPNISFAAFLHETFPQTTPFVRFGFPAESGGQRQEPLLRPIHGRIPRDAITVSPIYFLAPGQRDRLTRFKDTPYATSGSRNIAQELQDECEHTGHVLYPIYAESDALDDGVPLREMADWLLAYANDVLDLTPAQCHLYYSGGRSVHLHTPRFTTHEQLQNLKESADQYCAETGIDLDTSIYTRKRQFRLPGVIHEKTGRPKIPLDPDDPNGSVARRLNTNEIPIPVTVLELFEESIPIGAGIDLLLDLPDDTDTEERTQYGAVMPSDPGELDEWYAYNRHEFSPYANAARGSRSVVVFRVLGDLFEKDTKHGRYPHVPALIYAGHGCTGTDYTKYHEYAPVQLSTIDAEKWDYDTGDTVVLIGGQSRSSRIFRIPEDHAIVLAETHLHYETGDRDEALAYLDAHGYDTGHNPTRSHSATTKPQKTERYVWDSTTAAGLERRAERDGIHTLTHRERRRIAFRLLKRGWQYAWDWFEEQYATDFDPTITNQQLADCIRAFPDDYDHITIPK